MVMTMGRRWGDEGDDEGDDEGVTVKMPTAARAARVANQQKQGSIATCE